VERTGPARVERLVRDLITHYGLAATLLSVRHEPPQWLIVIRGDSDRVFDLTLPDTLTVAQLRTQLEAHLLTRV